MPSYGSDLECLITHNMLWRVAFANYPFQNALVALLNIYTSIITLHLKIEVLINSNAQVWASFNLFNLVVI